MYRETQRRAFLKNLLSLSAFIAGSTTSLDKNFKTKKFKGTEALGLEKPVKKFKKIAVEEHFHTKKYLEWLYSRTDHKGSSPAAAASKVVDLGEGRIKDMDECGVDIMILSLSYPDLDLFKTEDAIAMSKMVNDELSEAIRRYPDRFTGYCCLPLQNPETAADELERAVSKLGLRGVMVNTVNDRWLSDQKYEIVYERSAKLDVPIYLHQTGSGEHIIPDLIKLIDGDLLDKYPNLHFILGHGGEAMPFWLYRRRRSEPSNGKKSFKQKFIEHFYVTTSDQCWPELLQFLIAALGSDRIMFSTDYPYESLKQHVDFIDSVPISESDREKICHLNAEKLFKLQV